MSGYGAHDLEEFEARFSELRSLLDPPVGMSFVAYTDGACFGNPSGPGGWASVTFPADGSPRWLLFGHLSSTSNNRAEALGVLAAFEWIPDGSRLSLHSDSELTIRLLQGRYKLKSNRDIWERILARRVEKHLDVSYEWVRGHAGDPLNELADRLANLGAAGRGIEDLDPDVLAGRGTVDVGPGVVAGGRVAATPLEGLEPRTDWEREFLTSVRKQLSAGRQLSPKQQAVVDRIRSRGQPSGR